MNLVWPVPIDRKKGGENMQYSFVCPSPCEYTINVEAQSDEEAVGKIVEAGKVHAKVAHPDMGPVTDDEMKSMVRAAMKKA